MQLTMIAEYFAALAGRGQQTQREMPGGETRSTHAFDAYLPSPNVTTRLEATLEPAVVPTGSTAPSAHLETASIPRIADIAGPVSAQGDGPRQIATAPEAGQSSPTHIENVDMANLPLGWSVRAVAPSANHAAPGDGVAVPISAGGRSHPPTVPRSRPDTVPSHAAAPAWPRAPDSPGDGESFPRATELMAGVLPVPPETVAHDIMLGAGPQGVSVTSPAPAEIPPRVPVERGAAAISAAPLASGPPQPGLTLHLTAGTDQGSAPVPAAPPVGPHRHDTPMSRPDTRLAGVALTPATLPDADPGRLETLAVRETAGPTAPAPLEVPGKAGRGVPLGPDRAVVGNGAGSVPPGSIVSPVPLPDATVLGTGWGTKFVETMPALWTQPVVQDAAATWPAGTQVLTARARSERGPPAAPALPAPAVAGGASLVAGAVPAAPDGADALGRHVAGAPEVTAAIGAPAMAAAIPGAGTPPTAFPAPPGQPPAPVISARDMSLSPVDAASGNDDAWRVHETAAPTESRLPPGPARAVAEPGIVRSLALQLTGALRAGADRPVELTLDPEELGRVRMTLSPADGKITVSLAVERADTAELIRRHLDLLAEDFRALGFGDVSFEFAGGGTDAEAGGDGPPPSAAAPPGDDPVIPATEPIRLRLGAQMDLRL